MLFQLRFLPIFSLLIVWIIQYIFYFFVNDERIDKIDNYTILISLSAIFFYFLGSCAGFIKFHFYEIKKQNNLFWDYKYYDKSRFYLWFKIILSVSCILEFTYSVVYQLYLYENYDAVRNAVLESWQSSGLFGRIQAIVINNLAGLTILALSFEYRLKKKVDLTLAALFFSVVLSSYSRTLLLIGTSVFMVGVLAEDHRLVRKVLCYALVFFAVFMAMAIGLKDYASLDGTLGDFFLGHVTVYLFGGLAGLNNYIQTASPHYDALLTIPRFIQAIYLFGEEMPPSYFDFVNVPTPLNIFTAIYPPYHDYGLFGVCILFIIYGYISTKSCIQFATNGNYIWQMISGFFIYATVMSIFDDQFIRGLPVFFMMLNSSVIFNFLSKKFVILSSKITS